MESVLNASGRPIAAIAARFQQFRWGLWSSAATRRGLAAKYAGLSFDSFKSEMEQSEEFMALSAWRKAAEAAPR